MTQGYFLVWNHARIKTRVHIAKTLASVSIQVLSDQLSTVKQGLLGQKASRSHEISILTPTWLELPETPGKPIRGASSIYTFDIYPTSFYSKGGNAQIETYAWPSQKCLILSVFPYFRGPQESSDKLNPNKQVFPGWTSSRDKAFKLLAIENKGCVWYLSSLLTGLIWHKVFLFRRSSRKSRLMHDLHKKVFDHVGIPQAMNSALQSYYCRKGWLPDAICLVLWYPRSK